SIYLKNNETHRSAHAKKIGLPPTDRTDRTAKTPGAVRGPCARCGHPVTWATGLRNWFGHLVHLTCPAPVAPRRPATWDDWREGDPCPSCGRAEHEHEHGFFGCGLAPASDATPAPLERKAPPPVAPVRWTE